MIELTPRQSEVYEAIKVHIEKVGFPPTLIELAGLIGCSSQNAAAEHVKALNKKGYITIARGAARGISLVEGKPKQISIGMNTLVKVKLSPMAINELKRIHDESKIRRPWLYGDFISPNTDDEGFVTMPLWKVMSDLGGICYNGADLPFEIAIDLEGK